MIKVQASVSKGWYHQILKDKDGRNLKNEYFPEVDYNMANLVYVVEYMDEAGVMYKGVYIRITKENKNGTTV